METIGQTEFGEAAPQGAGEKDGEDGTGDGGVLAYQSIARAASGGVGVEIIRFESGNGVVTGGGDGLELADGNVFDARNAVRLQGIGAVGVDRIEVVAGLVARVWVRGGDVMLLGPIGGHSIVPVLGAGHDAGVPGASAALERGTSWLARYSWK